MIVQVCPLKDTECGDSRIRWCATCPKHKPVGMRGPVAFIPAFWVIPKNEPQKLDWSDMTTSTTHDHRAKEAQHTMTAQQMAEREAQRANPPPSDAQIASMKRAATRLKKATPGLAHTEALNRIARERGFPGGWYGVVKALRGRP